jgi:hypothetical protein
MEDMGRLAGPAQGGDETIGDAKVPVQDLALRAAVDASEVDDGIGCRDDMLQGAVVSICLLITRYSSVMCASVQ